MKKINKIILGLGFIAAVSMLIFALGMRFPNLLHTKHEYKGYTYYSSIFNRSFDENEARYAFDSILQLEPEYKYLLDSFYKDGYSIYFDDKFTYAWCTGDPVHSNEFSACVTFDRLSGDVTHGMFVNYVNDYFSDKIFFHELCHYADHKLGDISQSEEFARIYDDEYNNSTLASNNYYKDKKEYFAEESAYYIIEDSYKSMFYSPYGKHEDAPATFEFVKENLNRLREGT